MLTQYLTAEEDDHLESLNDRFTVKINTLKEFDEIVEIAYLKKLLKKNKNDYLKGLSISIVASLYMLRHRNFKIENSDETRIFEDEI